MLPGVQRRGEPNAVQPRRADLLERRVRAAAHREIAGLDRPDAGVERRLNQVPHVRRQVDPREPRLVEPVAAPPVLRRHDRERRVDRSLGVEQPRQLAHRHPVPRRHAHVAGESNPFLVEQRPLDPPAVDRVRPVEHDDLDLPLRRFLHDVPHRADVGVEPHAHVLDVDDQGVDAGQHGFRVGRRVSPYSEWMTRPGLLVLRRGHLVVEGAADPVLRTEERDERQSSSPGGTGRSSACRRTPGPCGW